MRGLISILALGVFGFSGSTEVLSKNTEPAAKKAPETATIKGVVKFSGDPPKRRKISMTSDKVCHKAHAKKVRDESVIVNENGTLKNVIVSVKKGIKGKFDPPKEAAILDQKGCMYTPHVFAVQVGQTVKIKNSDPVLHNVHSFSKKNPSFNIGQTAGSADLEKVFKKNEMITLKCDVHGWMSSYIGVFKHPFFHVTGDDGSFELKGLPAGTYTIQAWHEVYDDKRIEVTVAAGETKTIEYTFEDE